LVLGIWPDGVLVSDPPYRHEQSVERTKQLLDDPDVTVIFEAGFTELGTRVRADVLVRESGSGVWDMIEVKSSSSLKEVYDVDLTVQQVVLEASGVEIGTASLLLIDKEYRLEESGLDLKALTKIVDRSDVVAEKKQEIIDLVKTLHSVISANSEPDIAVGPHCEKPYSCRFFDYCTADRPVDWVKHIPGFGPKKVQDLELKGIISISDIPSNERLNDLQRRAIDVSGSSVPWISPNLGAELDAANYPIGFVDFEAATPGVPAFISTGPGEQIPFQWSCHILDKEGQLRHSEYLAHGNEDPRREFIETLLDATSGVGSIVVYSWYESKTLERLKDLFDDLAPEIDSLLGRLLDLLPLTKRNYYHSALKGSFSIKDVLPVVAPGFDYSDLAIQEGETAAARYLDLVEGRVDEGDAGLLRSNLLAYCERDTEAMVRIWQHLEQLAER
jgi:CRISPR/Cas system-associated exonuclease Cas4 (RecB family)